jgi:hypothetical protein
MKCHKKTSCVGILTKNVFFFFFLFFFLSYIKLENRSVEQVLSGGVGTSGKVEEVGKW